jgi:RecB family exonuclease
MPRNVVFPYPDNFFDDGLPKGVLSPSGINRYRSCPRQFYYAYIRGIIRPPGIAAAKGKAIHAGAEAVHGHTINTGTPLSKDEAIAFVADEFDREVEDVATEDKENPEVPIGVVKDATLSNFRVYYKSAVPLIRPVAVEKAVAFKVGSVPVRGIIDLIDRVPGEYTLESDPDAPPPLVEVVSDLKTTKRKWTDQQVQFEPQLTLYAIAENTEHVRIDLLLDQKSGCKYSPLRAERSLHEKSLITEDVEEIARCIKQGAFPRCNPTGWNCTPKWCGYYEDCRGPK